MSKAQFIGGQIFWDTFTAFRVCWLRGRYGGGKTAMGVLMAARLLAEKRVKQVVSNIPLSFNVVPSAPLAESAILLDESWIYIENRKDVLDYAGFVRKFNHYLILPSVFPIHNRLSFFFVQRIFNGYTVGLPAWFYRWGIRDKDVKESGVFALWNPKAVYFHYPTNFVAGDDGGISDVLHETTKKAGFKGTRREFRTASVDIGSFEKDIDYDSDISETLDDFSQSMDNVLADMETQTRKIIKSKNR